MRGVILDHKGGKSYILLRDGTFRSAEGFTDRPIGSEIEYRAAPRTLYLRAAALAACLLLFISLGLFYSASQAVAYYVYADINPSVELQVNRFDRIVEATGINGDGAALLAGSRLRGPIGEALSQLLELAQSRGYSPDDAGGRYLQISVVGEDDSHLSAVTLAIEAQLEAAGLGGCSSVRQYTPDQQERAAALGVSPGKLALAEQLQLRSADLALEELLAMPIAEIDSMILQLDLQLEAEQKARQETAQQQEQEQQQQEQEQQQQAQQQQAQQQEQEAAQQQQEKQEQQEIEQPTQNEEAPADGQQPPPLSQQTGETAPPQGSAADPQPDEPPAQPNQTEPEDDGGVSLELDDGSSGSGADDYDDDDDDDDDDRSQGSHTPDNSSKESAQKAAAAAQEASRRAAEAAAAIPAILEGAAPAQGQLQAAMEAVKPQYLEAKKHWGEIAASVTNAQEASAQALAAWKEAQKAFKTIEDPPNKAIQALDDAFSEAEKAEEYAVDARAERDQAEGIWLETQQLWSDTHAAYETVQREQQAMDEALGRARACAGDAAQAAQSAAGAAARGDLNAANIALQAAQTAAAQAEEAKAAAEAAAQNTLAAAASLPQIDAEALTNAAVKILHSARDAAKAEEKALVYVARAEAARDKLLAIVQEING